MKTIKLLKLTLDNFKCFKHKEVNFSARSFVKGRNGIGKTTLYNAVLWVLFDKDMSGSSAQDIRPHDESGKEIDNFDISVSATFDVDGREITLTKTQKQNWVKKRGTDTRIFQGNVNEFSVNEIPKAQKDYKTYIEQNFCPEDVFLSCANASSFFKLDTKKRRAKLMQLVQNFTDADVIATNTEFSPLANMLADGTIDELTTRSKATMKQLNETLKQIPARIDEQEKSKVDIDVAELELQKRAIEQQIFEVDGEILDLSSQYEELQKASDRAMEIRFAMSDMERNANEENNRKRMDYESKIMCTRQFASDTKQRLARKENEIAELLSAISTYETRITEKANEWREEKNRVFDDSSLVCSYCGQGYPEAKKDALRAEFESHKQEKLDQIEHSGQVMRNEINSATEEINKCHVDVDALKQHLEKSQEDLSAMEKILLEIPDTVVITKSDEYKALERELAEKETFLEKSNSATDVRSGLILKKTDMSHDLEIVKNEIAKAQRNIFADERIAELEQEKKDTAQKIANEEKTLFLLEKFNKAKMDMLTERVNKRFRLVKWKLFSENINGGYADVCQAVVNGSNYETALNHGDRILADMDILNTFQQMNDIRLPIYVDDTESVDDWRIPALDTQMILLRRTDDKEMIIESEDK